MMRRLLLLSLVLVAAVWLGQQLGQGSGYLLLVLPDGLTSIEMSFWTGLALVLLGWLAISMIFVLLGWLRRPLGGLGKWRHRQRQRRIARLSLLGLQDLAEGRWKRARRRLLRAAPEAAVPALNYLAAAHAAHYEGQPDEAQRLLGLTTENLPKASLLVDFSHAHFEQDRGHYEQALATLVRLKQQVPHHPLVLRQLHLVYLALQDWQKLRQLLPELRQHQIYPAEELDQLELQVYSRYFAWLQQVAPAEGYSQRDLNEQWETLPTRLKQQETLVLAFCDLLCAQSCFALAENLLRKALQTHWSSQLVAAYGALPSSGELQRRLLHAEQWLKERPNDAALLHALGRISQQLKLWGKALEYYETSYQLLPTADLCLELSQLCQALHKPEKSEYYYRQAMTRLRSHRLPQLPLP